MLKDIKIPLTRNYHSGTNDPPIKLYLDIFSEIKKMDLELGFFSTSAFQVLSYGLAQFIHNGGILRIIANSHISAEDAQLIKSENDYSSVNKGISLYIEDERKLAQLQKIMRKREEHFFNCLLYLKSKDRLIIQPVQPIHSANGMAHTKNCVVSDNKNHLYFSGSTNFTGNALLNNIESLDVSPDWLGDIEGNKAKIEEFNIRFEKIINKKHPKYKYLTKNQLIKQIDTRGENKELLSLFEDEIELGSLEFEDDAFSSFFNVLKEKKIEFEEKVKKIEMEPHFPNFDNKISEPREYQKEAYIEWVKNNHKGIFAMATGTGKTITALNCVLEEFKRTKEYNVLIVVPTIDLVNQWKEELEKFNFSNILQVSSKHKWKSSFVRFVQNTKYDIKSNIAIVTTYRSFVNENFFELYTQVESKFILIGDEAHNIGSKDVLKKFKKLKTPKMIALSATPKRVYDPEGTKCIEEIFEDNEPYTYVFSLERAIKENFLTRYLYFPKVVKLNDEEFEEYKIITKKLVPFFTDEGGLGEGAQMLLLKRKRIIHKAKNKEIVFKEILKELDVKNKLSHAFVFAPEGKHKDNDINILDSFIKIATDTFPKLRVDSFTSRDIKREGILKSFEIGILDMVFAMKALDEGVDIPRTEVGVFTSSTGNPRQFIQRRGRVLRKHPDKDIAIIYDMIVVPDSFSEDTFNLERSLLKQELIRVGYFADLADNFYQSKEVLNEISEEYNLNLETIISELQNDN